MKSKLWFALRVAAISMVLFAVWPFVSGAYAPLLSYGASLVRGAFGAGGVEIGGEKNSYFYIPVIAMILAAPGLDARRKLAWVGLALGVMLSFDLLNLATGLTALAEVPGDLYPTVYRSLVWALPVSVILLLVGGNPAGMWAPPVDSTAQAPARRV